MNPTKSYRHSLRDFPQSFKLSCLPPAGGGSQSSVLIPHEAGIFRKHGLDIELLYVGGGGRAAQVAQSGKVPIGIFPAVQRSWQ